MSFLELDNSKNNDFKIHQILDFLYTEIFSDILIEEKTKFIKRLENNLTNVLNRQNRNNKIYYEINNSLLEKEKLNIINRYEKEYSILKNELQKYEKNPKEIKYLTNFRKHCINLDQIPLHKCSENVYGKFIEVYEEKKRKFLPKKTKEKALYVICNECYKCYSTDFIKILCSCCKKEYYSNKLDEKDNENILPATWEEYHCKPIIVNETMKCIKCENILYINLYTKKLVCLNQKCNFKSDSKSIIWKCRLCQEDFTSLAKIFNPLENKILQNSVFKCLLNKEICFPQKLYCCCLIKRNNKYTHNKNCEGELYKGSLNNKLIVVCSKCHAVNYYEKFIWTCPLCNLKFYYNGKRYKKENISFNSHKMLYSLEKYQNINIKANNPRRNLSSNIRVFINNFDNKKPTQENNDSFNNNLLYNKNTYDSGKNKSNFVYKYKYLKKKKNSRYKTLSDILTEKKNQRNKNSGKINYNITEEISNVNDNDNDNSYQYEIKEEKLEDIDKKNATKEIKYKKNFIQNYIYKNDIVVNININSNTINNTDNIMNLSNISNSEKFIPKKKNFDTIDENPKENYIYEYESIRRNLHKKHQADNYQINNTSNNLRASFQKEKKEDNSKEKYKLIYNSHLISDEKEKITEDKNEGRESTFYHKKNLRNKFFKKENKILNNNTINIQSNDNNLDNNKPSGKTMYRRFRKKEIKEEENNNEENNTNIINNNIQKYRSSRFKQNKFYRKLLLNKEQNEINNNKELNNIPENDILISPLGDLGSSLISKDDFLKISKECKIPSFDENNISYIKPIGQGSYGVIYLVEEKNKKIQYALKSILCNDLDQILKHKKEFELSYSLSHDNFVKIYNALFKYLDMTTYILYILMEKGESDWGKEIETRAKLNKPYTEKELIGILKQLINVLFFFQKNNIAHRDIKPQNVLIFKNNVYKITDLGEAKNIKNNNTQFATLKGSQYFMSPNLFNAFKYNGNKNKVIHNIFKSDVFSLGYCFLYAMNLSIKIIQNLREENNMKNVINIVKKFGLDKKYSEKFMNIIYNMIQVDENKRWDFIELYYEINKIF